MKPKWLIGLLGVASIGVILGIFVMPRSKEKQVFHVSTPPAFLEESLAVSFAAEALENAKPNGAWLLKRYSTSHAPDGSADGALLRNEIDSNEGLLHFESASLKEEVIVVIELRNTNVYCRVEKLK